MYNDVSCLRSTFREVRHNHCFMTVVSIGVIVVLCLYWLLLLIFQFPATVIGMIISPVLARGYWIIEFIYPMSLLRWGHLFILRTIGKTRWSSSTSSSDTNNATSSTASTNGCHSRTIETRIEIIKDYVYIHPLPQFLDNIGYLIVCLPPTSSTLLSDGNNGYNNSHNESNINIIPYTDTNTIIGILVDCGDAESVIKQLSAISTIHYRKKEIMIHSILSTHKHHDHTAGNATLIEHFAAIGSPSPIQYVFGGAIENVPCCNYPLSNGDILPLHPYMNQYIEIEAIATPAHTRGSITYALRPSSFYGYRNSAGAVYLFTGDTLFSGGSGVPFEADIDTSLDSNNNPKKMTANTFISASTTTNATERCFAEILYRCINSNTSIGSSTNVMSTSLLNCDTTSDSNTRLRQISNDQIILLAGHEYTSELLSRQLVSKELTSNWKVASPAAYFATVAQYYITYQKRFCLPSNTGKLLCSITSVRNEVLINPQFRSLVTRGEIVLTALQTWNKHWATQPVVLDTTTSGAYGINDTKSIVELSSSSSLSDTSASKKTPSSASQWNIDATTINQQVYTTVYTVELDSVIDELKSGILSPENAVTRLKELKTSLYNPIVSRRPIPGTLPSNKTIYKGLLGFAILGSSPTGMTPSDSRIMKINIPINTNSDCIPVSKQRLITVLYHLGLLDDDHNGNMIAAIIHNLWKETVEYIKKSTYVESPTGSVTYYTKGLTKSKNKTNNTNTDNPDCESADDSISSESELKEIIFGDNNSHSNTSRTGMLSDTIQMRHNGNKKQYSSTNFTEMESSMGTFPKASNPNIIIDDDDDDVVPLGALKWIIYGIPEQTKSKSFFSSNLLYCLPCFSKSKKETATDQPSMDHPAGKSNWAVHTGELVRHDIVTCKISQPSTGYNPSITARPTDINTGISNNNRYTSEILRVDVSDTTNNNNMTTSSSFRHTYISTTEVQEVNYNRQDSNSTTMILFENSNENIDDTLESASFEVSPLEI